MQSDSKLETIQLSLIKRVSQFRTAIISMTCFILSTNIILLWAVFASWFPQVLYGPILFNVLLTGSIVTAVFFRKELLSVQADIHEPVSKNRDIERDYQKFTLLCLITLPMMAVVTAITLLHIIMEQRQTPDQPCPTTYSGTVHHLDDNSKAITVLYVFVYVGIYVSTIWANYMIPQIAKLYDERSLFV